MSTETIRSAPESSSRSLRQQLGSYLIVCSSLGLMTGFVEVAITIANHFEQGHAIFSNEQFIWMTPVAEATLFLGLGLVALPLGAIIPRDRFRIVAVGLFAFVSAFSILFTIGHIHRAAMAMLALGVAAQASRFVKAYPGRLAEVSRRMLPPLVAAVVLLAAGLLGFRKAREFLAIRELPEAVEGAPNIVLVVLDTVRADAMSVYGGPAPTPNLESLSEQAILFEGAMATAPWTLPSHASLLTGRYPDALSADWRTPLDASFPTLAEVFADQGYATAGFVANLAFCTRNSGLARGFQHFEDFELSPDEILRHASLVRMIEETHIGLTPLGIYYFLIHKEGEVVTEGALRWIDRQGERPFFALLNYMDAHDPFLPDQLPEQGRPLSHEEKVAMRNWWKNPPSSIGEDAARFARSCYEAEISELDAELGRLFDGLRERDLWQETIVVVTSDHGELFGEHGVFLHGNNLYRPCLGVPLLIGGPAVCPSGGRRVGHPVSLRDVAATLLDLAGVPNRGRLGGTSLRRTWDGTFDSGNALSPPFATVELVPDVALLPMFSSSPASEGPIVSLIHGGDHLIRETPRRDLLFDFEEDPRELRNLAEHAEEGDRLDRALRALSEFLIHRDGVTKDRPVIAE